MSNRSQEGVGESMVHLRKIRTFEREFKKSVNVEVSLGVTADKVFQMTQLMIGSDKNEPLPNTLASETLSENQSPIPTGRRRGMMRMGSLLISQLYKDHFKYEFEANELYKLLGEELRDEMASKT